MEDDRSDGHRNSAEGPAGDNGLVRRTTTSTPEDEINDSCYHSSTDVNDAGPSTPPRLSSPSAASSVEHGSSALLSPLRRELSRSTLHDEPDNVSSSSSKLALAHRLSHLAQQLTSDDDDEELDELALAGQVEEMEKAMARTTLRTTKHRGLRPGSLEMRSLSDPGSSLLSSPPSSLFRSRFSDFSVVSPVSKGSNPAVEQPTRHRTTTRLSKRQTDKVIAEATKLNEELTIAVANLRARQEESDHIQELLIERAERAAQRIIFLQGRIAYLEQELSDNDDELQHLRICLKAVEVQMPPHPDPDIQRCIATFKQDYQALKKKRASRSSLGSYYDPESTTTYTDVTASPAR